VVRDSRSRPTRTTDASTLKGKAKIRLAIAGQSPIYDLHALKKSGLTTLTGNAS
jgi:hypothetical protein